MSFQEAPVPHLPAPRYTWILLGVLGLVFAPTLLVLVLELLSGR